MLQKSHTVRGRGPMPRPRRKLSGILLMLGLLMGLPAHAAETPSPAALDSLYVRAQKSRDTEAVRGILEKLKAALPNAPDPAGLYTRIGLLHHMM